MYYAQNKERKNISLLLTTYLHSHFNGKKLFKGEKLERMLRKLILDSRRKSCAKK